MWDLIDNPNNKSATEKIQSFFILNQRIIEKVGVYDNTWLQYAKAYDKLMTLIQQKSLNNEQKGEAYKLIDSLPDYPVTIKETFRTRIDNMGNNVKVIAGETTTASKVTTKPPETESDYIELIDSDGSKKITEIRGFEYPDGDSITIKSNKELTISQKKGDTDNISHEKDKKTMTIVVKANMQVVISISDKIQITITGKNFRRS